MTPLCFNIDDLNKSRIVEVHMTLHSLEIFVAVAKRCNMSDAAKELHIAQPTISQAIADLEKEYGVLLFNRLSRKLYITSAGEQLLGYAKNMIALQKEMNKSMLELAENQTIILGATLTVGKCLISDLVKLFEQKYPNIKVQVVIDNTATIEKLLLDSQIDIGLVEGTIKSQELIVNSAISDQLILVCYPSHPFALKKIIGTHELANQNFILREEGSGTREKLELLLRENNIVINRKWICHGLDAIIEAVLAEQGITLISERLVQPYVEQNRLCSVAIENQLFNRNFSLVYHKTKYISDSLNKLINFVYERYVPSTKQ